MPTEASSGRVATSVGPALPLRTTSQPHTNLKGHPQALEEDSCPQAQVCDSRSCQHRPLMGPLPPPTPCK